MAIAFGAVTSVSATTGTSLTYSSPSVSGSDTFGATFYHDGTGVSDVVTGITWNGSAMTKIGSSIQVPSDRWIGAYYRIAPTAGVTNVTISASSSTALRSFSSYYTGAHQTTPLDSSNTGTVSANVAITVATTVVASNCWTVMFQKDGDGGITYSTSVGVMRINSDAGGQAMSDSNGTVGTGSQSTTLTGTGTPNHGAIAFSIAPAGASTTIKTYNGVVTANVKTVLNDTAIASRKTWNGIT